ncbi:YIP1 family protein [Pseudanabaena sp. FACHB-1998]|uniref:Yip1 family protein n=1 Tax=Pseudanabaena sp. FACHB-1998 TaxID=2692858 RepID=UPI0016811FDF|nr:Yip1 family protein [Pseudanabaena sp. FACHB-1998]MBD2178046.1 YIP1 family protein [Pseudanabaena sp. FACHB-1998]
MNATPNPEDINAIATDNMVDSNTSNAESITPPKPPHNLGTLLDRLYGTLFLPQVTFEQLKAYPSVAQGAIVIALVNSLETIRLDQLSLFRIVGSVISGLIGWLFFTFLLKQLAEVFQKNVQLVELLTLTGFASLPWIFMAPALSLPPQSRFLAAIAVIIWFIVWQIWGASVVLGIKIWKTLAIVPLAISGGVVALIWLGNAIKLLISIA